jgi:alpha-tubulin suppressor-like RCC1 family protein
LDIGVVEVRAKCGICGNSFVVEIAEKLSHADAAKKKKIKNLRERLSTAIDSNDIRSISDSAGKILDIIPEDYSAKYFFAYAANCTGNHNYISDFYSNSATAHTEEELAVILGHINNYGDLRDRVKIETFLMSLDDIDTVAAVDEYKSSFRYRKALEENYDDVPRDVFICHRSTDSAKAKAVVAALEQDSHKCWISSRNLRPNDSENYWDSIRKAITSCKVFLVVSSEDAMLSNDVKSELNIAKGLNKPRIEYKIDTSVHTTLFKNFFDGCKWVEGFDADEKSLRNLCVRVYDELERLKHSDKKPDKMDEIAELLKRQTSAAAAGPAGIGVKANVDSLIKRASVEIGDGHFSKADEICEKIADIDIENGQLWCFRLLIEVKAKSLDGLARMTVDVTGSNNYRKAKTYADNDLKEKLEAAAKSALEKLQEKQRIEREKQEEQRLKDAEEARRKQEEADRKRRELEERQRQEAERQRQEAVEKEMRQMEMQERIRKKTKVRKLTRLIGVLVVLALISGSCGYGIHLMNRPIDLKIVAVSAAIQHNLAIDSDGNVWAWGTNHQGQVGDGTTRTRRTPVQVTEGIKYTAVFADTLSLVGANYPASSLAIDENGGLWAWGRCPFTSAFGTTGIIVTHLEPVQINTEGRFNNNKIVEVGRHHAIDEHGNLWMWRLNSNMFRHGITAVPTIINTAGRMSDAKAVSVVRSDSLLTDGFAILDESGSVWRMMGNSYGRIDRLSIDAVVVSIRHTGSGNTFAIDEDGDTWAWGPDYGNTPYVLSEDELPEDYVGKVMPNGSEIVSVSYSMGLYLAIDQKGNLWAWGENTGWERFGRGIAITRDADDPVQVTRAE